MTKNEIKDLIIKTAAEYGFETEETRWSTLPQIKKTTENYISFTINDSWLGFDFENKTALRAAEIRSSVCQMGGNPTPEDLLRAADEIRRGAELTAKLQSMNLEYTEEVK